MGFWDDLGSGISDFFTDTIPSALETVGNAVMDFVGLGSEPPTPPDIPPPRVIRLPYPTANSLDEILIEETLDCTTCELSMKSIASVSTVMLTRDVGALSYTECDQFEIDQKKVEKKELSMFEFASRIHQGLYSSRKEAADGYCRELGMSDYNLQRIAQGEAYSDSMLIYKRNRRVTPQGGFSGESKATVVFSLPIEIVFSGVAPYLQTTADVATTETGEATQVAGSGGFGGILDTIARQSGGAQPEGFQTREHFFPLLLGAGGAIAAAFGLGAISSGGDGGPGGLMQRIEETLRVANLGPNDYPFANETPTQTQTTGTIVNRSIKVKSISLYYPFPLRVNGKQYEAALAFNDPSTGATTDTVLLIPLVVSQSGDENSAKFIRQFAKYLPAIRDVDPMTGLYPRATVPTGTQWNLTQLFGMVQPPKGATIPGEPNTKANERFLVKNGYYLWTSPPGYDPDVKTQTAGNGQEIQWHAWKPQSSGLDNSTLYIMLDYPLAIDSTDFVTLTRTLPATNPKDAIHLIPVANAKYITHKYGTPPPDAGGAPTNKPPCGNDLCKETYLNYNSAVDYDRAKDQYENLKDVLSKNYSTTNFDDFLNKCPGAKCDVFLQNLKQVNLPDHRIVLKIIYSALFLLAIVVGVYIALAAINRGYHSNVVAVGETFGKLAGITARNWVTGADPTPRPRAPSTGPSFLDRMSSTFRRRSKTPTPQ
jgi:hypothetical protein